MLFPRLNCYLITRNFDIPTKCLQHINFQSLNISNSAMSLSPSPTLFHTHFRSYFLRLWFFFQRVFILNVAHVCVCVRVCGKLVFLPYFQWIHLCISMFMPIAIKKDRTQSDSFLIWWHYIGVRERDKKGKREVFNEMLNGCKAFAKHLSRTTDFILYCIHQLIYWRYFSISPFAYNSWNR